VSHGARKVAGELILELVPLVDRVLVERLEPCEWCLVQTEGKVEGPGVVVATSVFDGEGVASEPLDWVLLASYIVIPSGLNFSGISRLLSREEKVGKSSLSPTVEDLVSRISSILRRAS
jgi:hypothetical protein